MSEPESSRSPARVVVVGVVVGVARSRVVVVDVVVGVARSRVVDVVVVVVVGHRRRGRAGVVLDDTADADPYAHRAVFELGVEVHAVVPLNCTSTSVPTPCSISLTKPALAFTETTASVVPSLWMVTLPASPAAKVCVTPGATTTVVAVSARLSSFPPRLSLFAPPLSSASVSLGGATVGEVAPVTPVTPVPGRRGPGLGEVARAVEPGVVALEHAGRRRGRCRAGEHEDEHDEGGEDSAAHEGFSLVGSRRTRPRPLRGLARSAPERPRPYTKRPDRQPQASRPCDV